MRFTSARCSSSAKPARSSSPQPVDERVVIGAQRRSGVSGAGRRTSGRTRGDARRAAVTPGGPDAARPSPPRPHDLREGGEHLVADRRPPSCRRAARIAAAEHPDQLRTSTASVRYRSSPTAGSGRRVAAQPRRDHGKRAPARAASWRSRYRRIRPAVQQHDQRPAAPLRRANCSPLAATRPSLQQTRHQPMIGLRLRPGTQGTTRCPSRTPSAQQADHAGSRRQARRLRPVTARQHPAAATVPRIPCRYNEHTARLETDLLM